MFEGFHRWDGVYFLHVAEYGYSYENTLAFFPLYPFMVRLMANSVFAPLQYLMNYSNVLLTTSVLLNFWLFIKAAKTLYLLGEKVLGDETLAFKAAQLFDTQGDAHLLRHRRLRIMMQNDLVHALGLLW